MLQLLLLALLAAAVKSDGNVTSEGTLQDFPALDRPETFTMYLSKFFGCGQAGFCGYKCFETVRRGYNSRTRTRYPLLSSSNSISSISRNGVPSVPTLSPVAAPLCPRACMPSCYSTCLDRYNRIVGKFMETLTASDLLGVEEDIVVQPTFRVEEDDETPLCRPECMPACDISCISRARIARTDRHVKKSTKQCKPACMPLCTEACLNTPPMMVPCIFQRSCRCPAGYVQCSENTCCMKYRSMAIRYRNHMTKLKFEDDKDEKKKEEANKETKDVKDLGEAEVAKPSESNSNKTEKEDKKEYEKSIVLNSDVKANKTEEATRSQSNGPMSKYVQALRQMGGAVKVKKDFKPRELENNATVVYYPEEKKAEIVFNDGKVLVEKMEPTSNKL